MLLLFTNIFRISLESLSLMLKILFVKLVFNSSLDKVE